MNWSKKELISRGAARVARSAVACCIVFGLAAGASADPCVVPDDAGGTVTLPPAGCQYLTADEVHLIVDGLPPNTTIELAPIHRDFICEEQGGTCTTIIPPGECEAPGGGLGGHGDCFMSTLELQVTGTGDLAGFNRTLFVQVACEVHTGPRTPNDPVQTFPNDMFSLEGGIFGDPDFDLLSVRGGTAFGMPSPGQTTLTRLGPLGSDFAVDSFFDIFYEIDFQGAPGSVLEGMAGTTMAGPIRMRAYGPLGPAVCLPTTDLLDCEPTTCDTAGEECLPACVTVDRNTGQMTVESCDCRDPNECHVDLSGGPGRDNPCTEPNVGGTVVLPPAGCAYLTADEVHAIVDGLPPNTEIILDVIHYEFQLDSSGPGGTLGGEFEQFTSFLQIHAYGTGDLAGYDRFLGLQAVCETHTALRTPGDAVQDFDTDMFKLDGDLFGDPDFCTLRITAGTGNGLPSPGHTTLTRLGLPGSQFVVDSFFDISYQIDFQGCPGGPLDGLSGVTQGTVRMQTGSAPACIGGCPDGFECRQTIIDDPTGSTYTVCCDCVPIQEVCEPDATGTDCLPITCPTTTDECVPTCVSVDRDTGQMTVENCDCRGVDECHVDLDGGPGRDDPCTVPNAGGTVVLPPVGCDYLTAEEVHAIVEGLPIGTTIELAAIHKDFICQDQTPSSQCSIPLIPLECEGDDPNSGGNIDCFESDLVLTISGVGPPLGGFSRNITIPNVFCEVHTGPRNPGDPVQSFDTDMFRLEGELFGDPDFCTLRITAGTDNGLPSPGHTTLTRQGPAGSPFAVDSFFDITYQIEFVGCPGSALDGFSGITQSTVRMQTGSAPDCTGGCPDGFECRQTITDIVGTNSYEVCCDCVPIQCEPNPAGTGCVPAGCDATEPCTPRCANFDPATGAATIVDCDCRGPNECHVELAPGGGGDRGPRADPCVVPDDAGGTVILPPAGCDYLSPEEFHAILDGLPAGTTIEMAPIHKDFICYRDGTDPPSWCPPAGICEEPGGTFPSGNRDCFESDLHLSVDFKDSGGTVFHHRDLVIQQVACTVDTAQRTPGAAVQDFDTEMVALQGSLSGDPDFLTLQVTAGQIHGLPPSPGHTTLTRLGPPGSSFAVDSFFDITYQIEYEGAVGGVLEGHSGTTEATIRMQTGFPTPPGCVGGCPPGYACDESITTLPDGTIDICCDCVPVCDCPGDMNSDGFINGLDIQGFVDCLVNGVSLDPNVVCECGDFDSPPNGLDMGDIPAFVNALLNGPGCP